MQADVESMEQQLSNPADESVAIEKAQIVPEDNTLDGMIEDEKKIDAVVEVDKEVDKSDKVNYKVRFTNYKTKTDATIFELRKENSNLITEVQLLSKRVEDMLESTKDTTTFVDRFSDVDKEIFGEDALSSLEKATNATVEPLKKQLAEEKEWRKKQLELQKARSKQEASTYFLTALAKAVPDYAEVDMDPSFVKFMNQPDTISGIPRVRLFKQAEHTGDAARVASFMNEFKEANKPVDNLKDKVSPVSTSAASPTQTNEGDKLSFTYVDNFYSDVLKGKYRKNEKARVEIETRINKALAQGNVY